MGLGGPGADLGEGGEMDEIRGSCQWIVRLWGHSGLSYCI